MTYQQLVVPDPDIPTKPGWCLQYVRQAFGAPVVEPTATAGWFNAKRRHTGTDFPAGCWVPVWFELDTEPAGHVALLAPDGSVYSTTSPTGNRATHHRSLADLYNAYAPYNPLTWRGWTEDISGVRVVQETQLSYESVTPTPVQEDTVTPEQMDQLIIRLFNFQVPVGDTGQMTTLYSFLKWYGAGLDNVYQAALAGKSKDPGDIAQNIIGALGDNLAADVVSEVGKRLAKVSG